MRGAGCELRVAGCEVRVTGLSILDWGFRIEKRWTEGCRVQTDTDKGQRGLNSEWGMRNVSAECIGHRVKKILHVEPLCRKI